MLTPPLLGAGGRDGNLRHRGRLCHCASGGSGRQEEASANSPRPRRLWRRARYASQSRRTPRRSSLRYRTSKGKKRSATIKIRLGAGTRVLAAGSRRIRARALATRKLRASGWATVRQVQPPAAAPAPAPAPPLLRFNLAGAVAVGMSGERALMAVGSDGAVWNALMPGSAVSPFFGVWGVAVGTDGGVVVAMTPTDTATGGPGSCGFARIDRASGAVTCVDSTPSLYVNLGSRLEGHGGIQFDAAGAMYYSGYTNGNMVIRKSYQGVVSELTSLGGGIMDWVVLADGSVIATGSTGSSFWTRRITPQGGIESLLPDFATFVRVFPDGNAYMGVGSAATPLGVRRFVAAAGQMDQRYWIARAGTVSPEPYFDNAAICGAPFTSTTLCQSPGSGIGDSVNAAGRAFVADAVLAQYYPRPCTPPA